MMWTAARRGRMPLVRWLVDRGANVEIPGSAVHVTQVMVSPYCIAVRCDEQRSDEYLLDHGAQVDVFCAAFLGELDVLRGHVGDGLGERAIAARGLPSRHAAALRGGRWIGRCETLLLENGAEVAYAGGRLLTSAANRVRSSWFGCSSTTVPKLRKRRTSVRRRRSNDR